MRKLKFKYLEDSKVRVDKFLADNSELSREYIKKLIGERMVTVGGKAVKSSFKLAEGDIIELEIPEIKDADIKPVEMNLDIVYEDDDILVINKQAGLVVHPGTNGLYENDSLVNAVMFHCGESLSGIGGEKRPGIVHRLDKDTSGLLIIAKNDYAHNSLMNQFKDRKVKKAYKALVAGKVQHLKGRIESPIGRDSRNRKKMTVTDLDKGKIAVSSFAVIGQFNCYTLLRVEIATGRMHQIRVHLASIGHPVVGDQVYGNEKINKRLKKACGLSRQFLHSSELTISHPRSGKEMRFKIKLPDDLSSVLSYVEEISN